MKSENQNSILFSDEARDEVATALSNLKRVDAPGDFDFKLRARIAQSEPAQVRRTGMLLVAKFALPVVVLLGFGAFLIVSRDSNVATSITQTADPQKTVVATTATEAPLANVIAESTNQAAPSLVTRPGSNSAVAPDVRSDPQTQKPGGGSYEETIKEADDPVYPRGLNPNARVEQGSITSNSQFSVGDLLSMLGISGEFSSNGFLVRSIADNSVASRAGLRGGDLIEAINDKPINAQTVFRGAFSGKSVRISRDGRRMNLNIGG